MINTPVDLIGYFEGFRETAYKPSLHDRWTVGFGFTNINGKAVYPGQTISTDSAKQYLGFLIENIDHEMGNKYKAWSTLSSNQHMALLSLVYNIGIGAFERSSMGALLSVNKLSNIPTRMLLWDKGPGGDKLPGLLKRRQIEAAIFEGEPYEQFMGPEMA